MEVADLDPEVVFWGEVNTGSLIKTEFFWKLGDNKWSTIREFVEQELKEEEKMVGSRERDYNILK